MNKIKVLYILTKADVGGAQKYVADLMENLDRKEFDPKILYGGKEISWLSNKVHPWFLFANDWLAVFELVKIFKKENPDIIHLNSSKAGVLGTLAAQIYRLTTKEARNREVGSPRVVFTAHGWVFNPTNKLNLFVRFFYIILHKLFAHFQNDVICVSEYDYHLALQYGIKPAGKLHTIHNGIGSDLKFLSKKEAREEILKSAGIKNNKLGIKDVWIGSIGRLVKEKNYETFVSAAKEILKGRNNKESLPYFFLIGEGNEKEKLKSQILNSELEERFYLINPTGDDAKYLKAFDIFVMSSIKEGLPYILLEAMAAEMPIVVTEAGGIPELIKNHRSGMMVSQKNPEQLGKAISGLLANPAIAREIAGAAKKTVSENFNISKMISKTEEVYENKN